MLSVLRKASNTSNTGAWPFPAGGRSQNFKKANALLQVAYTPSIFHGVLEKIYWRKAQALAGPLAWLQCCLSQLCLQGELQEGYKKLSKEMRAKPRAGSTRGQCADL